MIKVATLTAENEKLRARARLAEKNVEKAVNLSNEEKTRADVRFDAFDSIMCLLIKETLFAF